MIQAAILLKNAILHIKTMFLDTLAFLGLLTPDKNLSTDTVLLVGVVIKFLVVPAPNFADVPAIVALIASRVHKRQTVAKGNKEKLETENQKLKNGLIETVNSNKALEQEVKRLENRAEAATKVADKNGVWGGRR